MNPFKDERPEAWIPQRGAMRLIDRVVEVGAAHAVAEVQVPPGGLFIRGGAMPGWIGIEYMAQTVSAWAGGRARQRGGEPRLGLLLGTRRYTSHCGAFPAGARLRIEARCELMGDNGLGLFDCRIVMDGDEVANAQVSVFEPEDAMGMLKAAAT